MAINHHDGKFCLFLWLAKEGVGEPDDQEFSDDRVELRARAEQLIAGGRFKYVWMGALNDNGPPDDPWDFVEEFGGEGQ